MCMVLASPLHRIRRFALRPKTVYKVMEKRVDPTVVRSPHISHDYTLGQVQTTKIGFRRQVVYRKRVGKECHVYEGFHSFANLDDARLSCKELSHSESTMQHLRQLYTEEELLDGGYIYSVYRCEIPKFASYFKGFWLSGYPREEIKNIVSSALVIVEEVK